ncbi:hypothetical protein [uncultured Selenomonas sp.]|uniref:hypothetical protein n=1 Tax=uncultured Selenomonas sp. TaxID=159275 RepID=UPI0025CE2A28|nr:hypothetical protein [uncultured Selenomonas sp.]
MLARKAIVIGTGMVFFAVWSFFTSEVQPDLQEPLQDHSETKADIFWWCGAVEVPCYRAAKQEEPESSNRHRSRNQNLQAAIRHRAFTSLSLKPPP